eukprot:GFYU01000224.1.p1 GENE.GFYU01000224.1~~GFYU01000224.1.p1  ORF type:complete len:437 (+),score=152.17 GFYU01000224.1:31-1341(+)
MRSVLALVACMLALSSFMAAEAKVEELIFKGDRRQSVFMETFGYLEGGFMNVTVKNVKIYDNFGKPVKAEKQYDIGFLLQKSEYRQDEIEATTRRCLLTQKDVKERDLMLIGDGKTEYTFLRHIGPGEEGNYNLFYANCITGFSVDFDYYLTQYNPGPNYLSAGDSPLPTVYAICGLIFLGATGLWAFVLIKRKDRTHKIHFLMLALIVFKTITLFLEAMKFSSLKEDGRDDGWAIAYYVFTFLRGITLFVVILLIGTGWSFLKPFLSDKDKKILLFVIPLQVMANLAMVMYDSEAPGAQGWLTWKDIFKLIDIICCCAILLPIVWSIKHLREAAQTDGKAKRNLEKLTLFRQFYIMVVSYVYFTRIVIFLFSATLPFNYKYVSDFLNEVATLAFYGVTGWKFCPADNNPYLKVDDEDEEDDDEAIEMAVAGVGEP